MDKQELLAKWGEPTRVGTDGHVRLVDVFGDDSSVVQAARVSYGKGTKTTREDEELIRYLLRHRHTTPFEMCEIKLHIRCPMDVWRQWIRHRTASVNEYSTRYSEAIDSRNTTTPDEWRTQSKSNKQGSAGLLKDVVAPPETLNMTSILKSKKSCPYVQFSSPLTGPEIAQLLTEDEEHANSWALRVYELALYYGVAREQARKNLPLSTYTEAYWKIDLHNLMHFLALRLDPKAQQEIREFATVIFDIVCDWVPVVAGAFRDYRLDAVTFSGPEMRILRGILHVGGIQDWTSEERAEVLGRYLDTKLERIEFWKKIK